MKLSPVPVQVFNLLYGLGLIVTVLSLLWSAFVGQSPLWFLVGLGITSLEAAGQAQVRRDWLMRGLSLTVVVLCVVALLVGLLSLLNEVGRR